MIAHRTTVGDILFMEGSMNSLMTLSYKSKEVRTVQRDGEIWFVAKDVCDILKHSNSRRALERLSGDEKGVTEVYTLGGRQMMQAVNESGLYNLIFTSNRPEAQAFRKWVTKEVLPSIRKTGGYGIVRSENEERLQRLECEQLRVKADSWWRRRKIRKSDLAALERGVRGGLMKIDVYMAMFELPMMDAMYMTDDIRNLVQAESRLADIQGKRPALEGGVL